MKSGENLRSKFKKILAKSTIWIFGLIGIFAIGINGAYGQEQKLPEVNLFYSKTCLHCRAELEFLGSIQIEFPELIIRKYRTSDSNNREKLLELAQEYGAERYLGLVPLTFIGEDFFIGFDNAEGIG